MNIKLLYNTIIDTGISPESSDSISKQIKLLNTYILIWASLIIFFLSVPSFIYCIIKLFKTEYIVTYDSRAEYTQYITIVLFLIILYLNKIKRFQISKLIFLITVLANFSIFAFLIRPTSFSEYFFLIIPPLALSLYKKNYVPIIIFIISFFLFTTPYIFYPLYDNIITNEPFKVALIRQQFKLFFAVFLLVNYFKKINTKNEKLLKLEKEKVLRDKILLENQQQELKELNDFKSHFFVNLSHEIRTPLTLIQGHASQINLNDKKEITQQKINILKEQSQQIHSIVNDIMELGKTDSNEFQVDTKYIDLNHFLTKHFNQFKDLFKAENISFLLENKIENLAFKADSYLFSKSINNLLTNALKFTSQKGSVVLKAYLENQNLRIELIDNGIGIPKEDIDYIFDRFFQSENHITKSQGSGIGLAFTKNIIDAHNFSIHVKSNSSKTTFCIDIPKTALKNEISFTENSIPDNNSNYKCIPPVIETKSNRKVLIVEDYTEMRSYLKGLLNNYHITEAKHGQEALEILKNNTFDLIITDYMMPVMDGESLVQNIKKQHIKTPIIVLTARTDIKGKLNMLRLGIDGYLNKPFVKEELFLNIKQAFQSYDIINNFDKNLDDNEKQNLNKFAQKFNEELKDFIFNNMHKSSFGVDAIAEHFNISKSTLIRKVKTLLGQVPKDIIMEARLQKARILLEENPTETQKNIVNAVGISNTSYFFKKMEERFYKIN